MRVRFELTLIALLSLLIISCSDGSGPAHRSANAGQTETPSQTPPAPSPTRFSPTETVFDQPAVARVLTGPVEVHVAPAADYPILGVLDTGAEVLITSGVTSLRGGERTEWVAIPDVGWVRYEQSSIELSTSFDELPLVGMTTGPLYEEPVRTGERAIDDLLEAVAHRDVPWIRSHLVYKTSETTGREFFIVNYLAQGAEAREEASEWITAMLAGAYDARIDVPDPRLLPYAVLDLKDTPYEELGYSHYVVMGYTSGGSIAFYLTSDGEIAEIYVESAGVPPGEKLRIMRTSPPPRYILPPRVPEPLRPIGTD